VLALTPQVLLARIVETGELVAQKRVFVKKATHGVPDNLLREVKSMQAVSHPNVVELRDAFAQVQYMICAFSANSIMHRHCSILCIHSTFHQRSLGCMLMAQTLVCTAGSVTGHGHGVLPV
jgi:serine/threonine protein kinase